MIENMIITMNQRLTPYGIALILCFIIKITLYFFWKFTNKLIDIFQCIMVSMIPFIANSVFICLFAMNLLVFIKEIDY